MWLRCRSSDFCFGYSCKSVHFLSIISIFNYNYLSVSNQQGTFLADIYFIFIFFTLTACFTNWRSGHGPNGGSVWTCDQFLINERENSIIFTERNVLFFCNYKLQLQLIQLIQRSFTDSVTQLSADWINCVPEETCGNMDGENMNCSKRRNFDTEHKTIKIKIKIK